MNNRTKLIVGIAIALGLAFWIGTIVGCEEAKAGQIHDVLAIETVPELGHENVTLELGGYYTAGTDDIMDLGKDQGPVLNAGFAFGVAGYSVGVAAVHDRDDHASDGESFTAGAVGITFPVGEHSVLRVGAATSLNLNDGASFDRVTVGAKLRFGF